jgi:hypothetical protein
MSAPEKNLPARVEEAKAPTDHEIEQIRQRGHALVAHKQEVGRLFKLISGLEWGTGSSMVVRGSEMSEATRYAFAEFCKVTKANPLLHVDVLGGKPYLNANYWSDRINSDPFFHHFEQRDLSPSVEKALRERAARHRAVAAELRDADKAEAGRRLALALDIEDEADQLALDRAKWGAPEWATSVVETRIIRFIQVAPLDSIRRGDVAAVDAFLVAVPECNWAGNRPLAKKRRKDGTEYEYQPDPIGNVEPEKTARTRSLRRAATRSFPAWMQAYEEQIRKAEDALEAEWEVLKSEAIEVRAALPAANGPQAVLIGAGEPKAANGNGAKPLPVEEPEKLVAKPAEVPAPEKPAFDPAAAGRAFFGALHDAGVSEADRKKWAADHGLPESTKVWTEQDHAKALEVLLGPERKKLSDGAQLVGLNPEQLARERFSKGMLALTMAELRQLNVEIGARADAQHDGRLL